ncbi:unnamed protein product [Pedinophyceae sp. YPF-701]|nr:unnamed protein product [Pedinophyceae sp. YPF-701]
MFYSAQILAKKGPLGAIWIASHLDRKLKRQDVYGADLESAVETIIHPEAPLALRLSGQLLLGAARIYAKKVAFLYQDCTAVLASVRRAFHKASAAAAIDLPEAQRGGHSQAITLPEHNLGELLTLDMGPASLELLDPEEFATQAAIGPWGHKDSLSGGAELSSGALAGGRASALGASRLSTPGVEVERLRAAATPGTPARSLGGLGFGDDQLLPGGDLVGDMGELPDITGKTPASKRGSLAPATPSRPPGTPSQGEGGLFPVDDDLMPPESPGFGAADDVILDDGGFGDDGVDDDDGGRGRSPTPEAAPAPAPAAPAPRAGRSARPPSRLGGSGCATAGSACAGAAAQTTAPDGTLVPGGRGPAKRRRGGDADAAAAMLRDPAALLAMPATVGGGVASPLAAFMSQVAEEAWRRPRGGPAAEEGEEDEEGPRAESPAAEAELPVFDDGGYGGGGVRRRRRVGRRGRPCARAGEPGLGRRRVRPARCAGRRGGGRADRPRGE